jgi:glycolate oxidase iron-sulfur subunit
MKTNFSPAQLAEPHTAEADKILKSCQHFGFCTSGCPTYVLLHDENDGPRGRIDLIKEMLESDHAPKTKTVEHLDRCLSCMSCMTTCAVNVDYMHLIDTARAHIEAHHRRPFRHQAIRNALGYVLPRPTLFRLALGMGRMAKPFEWLVPRSLRHMLQLVPHRPRQSASSHPHLTVYPAQGKKKWRVALLAGCVQPVISPHINASTLRLLTQFGCEVVIPKSAGCCGSLDLHLGKAFAAREFAKANVEAWERELNGEGLDAILINASGCGTTVKDYGHLLKEDTLFARPAAKIAAMALDISEWLVKLELPRPAAPKHHRVAYHDACSLKNVQKVSNEPRKLLRAAGYTVVDVAEAHFCCGSAGTYNMLQPKLAKELGERKAANIATTSPQIVSAGNIGCISQIGLYSGTPIVHTVELLDWAYGGPVPPALHGMKLEAESPEPDATAVPYQSREQVITFVDRKNVDSDDVGIW